MTDDKFFIIRKKGRYGLCNFIGEEYFPCCLDEITAIKQKVNDKLVISAYLIKLGGKYGLISTKNQVLLPIAFDNIDEVRENLCLIPQKYNLNLIL